MRRLPAVLISVLAISGCSDDIDLAVDLRTDFVPGSEITGVTIALDETQVDHVPSLADPWLTGARVAEFRGIAPGAHRVVVSLYAGGRIVVQREVALSIMTSYALTVVISHSCAGVTCPRAGDPMNATTCVNGSCASPACGSVGEPACPACTSDTGCPPARATCATARCVAGACLDEPHSERCTAGQLCDLSAGCRAATTPMDAGPMQDAGTRPDAGSRDAGVASCDPDCTGRECGVDPICGDSCGAACADGASCNSSGRCVCPMTQAYCSGACVDLDSSLAHCGSCDVNCSGGTCTSGVCACPTGQTACRSGCVDLRTTYAHCGACDVVCSISDGPACCNGTCTFPNIDPMNCGGCGRVCSGATPDCCAAGCIDMNTDNEHCGRCGLRCIAPQTCVAGSCV